jgi:hypothetical protein
MDAVPSNSTTIRYVRMDLGDNGQSICEAINRQSGLAVTPAGTAAGTQGCIKVGTTLTAFAAI